MSLKAVRFMDGAMEVNFAVVGQSLGKLSAACISLSLRTPQLSREVMITQSEAGPQIARANHMQDSEDRLL